RDFHVTGVQTCALPISHTAQLATPANHEDLGTHTATADESTRLSPGDASDATVATVAADRTYPESFPDEDPVVAAVADSGEKTEIGRASCRGSGESRRG